MSAKKSKNRASPFRNLDEKPGCGGVGTVKQEATTAAAAHECCRHEPAPHALHSVTGCKSQAPQDGPDTATSASKVGQPDARLCKGDRA